MRTYLRKCYETSTLVCPCAAFSVFVFYPGISNLLIVLLLIAMIWGKSAKHSPQRCGINHKLADEDVVQVVTKTNAQQRQDKNYQSMVQGFNDKYHKKKLEAKKKKQGKLRR